MSPPPASAISRRALGSLSCPLPRPRNLPKRTNPLHVLDDQKTRAGDAPTRAFALKGALSHDELAILLRGARSVTEDRRDLFFSTVADLLRAEPEIREAHVAKAVSLARGILTE